MARCVCSKPNHITLPAVRQYRKRSNIECDFNLKKITSCECQKENKTTKTFLILSEKESRLLIFERELISICIFPTYHLNSWRPPHQGSKREEGDRGCLLLLVLYIRHWGMLPNTNMSSPALITITCVFLCAFKEKLRWFIWDLIGCISWVVDEAVFKHPLHVPSMIKSQWHFAIRMLCEISPPTGAKVNDECVSDLKNLPSPPTHTTARQRLWELFTNIFMSQSVGSKP